MREILFRGWNQELQEWVYGYFYRHNEQTLIMPHFKYPYQYPEDLNQNVDAESVGQFTGLRDRNGCDIFEGDILRNPKSQKSDYFVKFNVGGYDAVYAGNFTLCLHPVLSEYDGATVIGNVFRNPELYPQHKK